MSYSSGLHGILGSGLTRVYGAAASPWWLSGGVSAANAIAVYQPKGAASLAASYSNLANPGTYNAAPGVAPTWAAATGWTFAIAYLKTGINVAASWTAIVRFSDVANGGALFGLYKYSATTGGYAVFPNVSGKVYYYNAAELSVAPAATSGVVAIAGSTAYRNGASDGAITAGTFPGLADLYIGVIYNGGGIQSGTYVDGKIQALAIYNTTLTAPQVAAVSAAMGLL